LAYALRMKVDCPSCHASSDCKQIRQPVRLPFFLYFVGGVLFAFIYELSREPRFECSACVHRFFMRTTVSKVFSAIWYATIAFVIAAVAYLIYSGVK
jgi:hypothetical protein